MRRLPGLQVEWLLRGNETIPTERDVKPAADGREGFHTQYAIYLGLLSSLKDKGHAFATFTLAD